jgi:hypothetical protein
VTACAYVPPHGAAVPAAVPATKALAEPLLDTDPGALACNVSGPGTIPPADSVS